MSVLFFSFCFQETRCNEEFENATVQIMNDLISLDIYPTSPDDVLIPDEYYPRHLTEPHYDAVIIHATEDEELAMLFRKLLKDHIKTVDGTNASVCLLDDCPPGYELHRFMGEAVDRSTYRFLFRTQHFEQDPWAKLYASECIKADDKTCLVTIYFQASASYFDASTNYLFINRIFANNRSLDLNTATSLSIDRLRPSDLDPAFVELMQSVFNGRLHSKHERQERQQSERLQWESDLKQQVFQHYWQCVRQ